MRAKRVNLKQAPRHASDPAEVTPADEAMVDACRETLVGRAFGVRKVELHADGLGLRVYLGRSAP